MNKYSKPLKQQGIATIAILLFVGMAISVAVFGALRFIQGSQSQAQAFHVQTQAQRKAWAGVDITAKYLSSLSPDNLETLITVMPVKVEANQVQPKLNTTVGDPNLQLSIYKEELTDKVYLYAEITGEAAKNTKAHATSIIEAVFELQQKGGQSSSKSCLVNRTAVLRGNSNLTGGGTDFFSGDGLSDIAIEGNLTLSNSSKSGISGCVSGDVTMSGGGIKSNAALLVGGTFTVNSMASPNNVGVWARDINIGNTGSANYRFLRAGAYSTTILDEAGKTIGTSNVGGKLIASSAGTSIPWTSGILVPTKDTPFVIETSAGARLLVDLSDATIDESTGFVSSYSYEVLEGEAPLPDTLQFIVSGITGGDINIYSLKVNQLWGHNIISEGYSAKYTDVISNGDFSMGTGTIDMLIGGGDLTAINGGCSSASNCWNTPVLTDPSKIAGTFNIPRYSGSPRLNNLTTQVPNLSPGLPGIPFCDTRVDKVVVADLKASANYIFEEIGSKRQLTIKNVTLSNGAVLNGTYNLLTDDMRVLHGQQFLKCGWGNGHCFRDHNTWEVNGLSAFPPGIAWFDSSLKINGVGSNSAVNGIGNDLLNTFITAGNVNLTSSGHGDIIAPNFNPVALCDGAIRPTNLCADNGKLTGDDESGLPIANSAIISQNALDIAGWTINGHVTLGGAIKTSAGKVVINGGLVAGANTSSNTVVGQGGLEVNTQELTEGQLQTSCSTSNETSNEESGWQLKQTTPIWTRYL